MNTSTHVLVVYKSTKGVEGNKNIIKMRVKLPKKKTESERLRKGFVNGIKRTLILYTHTFFVTERKYKCKKLNYFLNSLIY